METVVVIGAGISGLSCAFRLKQMGINPLVLEAKGRPGGLIASVHRNGFLFESGPQCPRFPAAMRQLVQELKLEDEFISGPPRPKRYILRNGRLHAAPFSPGGLLTTSLVGFGAKLRIFADAFGSSQPPAVEETLGQFVERKFGLEILNNLVDPVVSTIFFGDPCKMGMESALPSIVEWERSHGSISRGAILARNGRKNWTQPGNAPDAGAAKGSFHVADALPTLGSFRSGMGKLPEKIAAELGRSVRYRSEIMSVAKLQNENSSPRGGWAICLANGDRIETEQLVLAIPAYAAAQLVRGLRPQLAAGLEGIEYAGACAVGFAYNRSQVDHSLDGFGFMVPRREGLNTICTFWNSSLFPQRAPAGKVLITSFVRNSECVHSEDGREMLLRKIEMENARILGITGVPLDCMFWADLRALPQYLVGHARRVDAVYNELRSTPNLHLIGNFLKGRSVGECIEIAERTAGHVHGSLQRNRGATPPCTR
jgi:oxygen-dependent protoporphyrinogen oxidase